MKRTYSTVLYLSFLFHNNNSITLLLSKSLTKELQFLPASEMGKFHTLALNFKDVTMHYRPRSVNLNERIYCKPIDATIKILFIEGLGSFLRQNVPDFWKLVFFG